VGAGLVLLGERISGRVDPEVFVGLLGISAVLTGVLRILGGFAAEERIGRRWTLGGIVLGTLEVTVGALLPLTSQPLTPQHPSTRSHTSVLLSPKIAMKRHGAG
jgi:uncharacterized membrane protein HdeD (DUF308 family)